jgi:hypothetical protein
MRSVSWGRLRRDEDDNVLGFLPQAFQLRSDDEYLSVNWIEYHDGDRTAQTQASVWAMRRERDVGAKSAFAVGNVGKLKSIALVNDSRVRITHEPRKGNPAHSGIRRLPRDDLTLLAALADDAFTEMVENADVPAEGIGGVIPT